MLRIIAACAGSLFVGIAAGYFLFGQPQPATAPAVTRDILDVPKVSHDVAERHRESRYVELSSIEDIESLPTAFARAEALHLLAGRQGAIGIQALIFDANRIADDVARLTALSTLFQRFAEIDPPSALALARTEYFRGDRALERAVWMTWARNDLDEALFAAKTQTSSVDQNSAAQSLFAAYGFLGNDTTERIRTELGIGPDRSTRGQFLYRMADRSPAEAIAWINQLPPGSEQAEYVWWLGHYLSRRDATAAISYATLFDNPAYEERYRSTIANNMAREDPRATLERIFASGNGGRQRGSELHSAIHALAEQDLDAALAYFAQVTSLEDRQMIGTVIGPLLAARSPSEALAWARANDNHEYPALEQAVLAEIAKKDPQYAIAEAVRSPHANVGFVVANVISQRAMNNPKQALELLEYVENPEQREMAAQQIATQWLRRDAKGAVEWMLSQNDESLRQMVGQSAHALVRHDVDQAMRVLPRLDVDQQQMMRMQIANHLAMNRSPAEAQNFVRQFADQPDYEPLQTAVIAGVARNNLVQARQMAGELLDPDSRNIAYTSIIAVSAARDPQSAVGLLASIGDENQRGAAAGQLASVWYGSDPRAAQQWVSSLPSGNVRDDAVMHLSGHWRNIGSEEQALIDSIGDADKRGQAKVRHIYSLMHTDPARAQQLLQDPDIPDYQRRQVEMAMQRRGFRY